MRPPAAARMVAPGIYRTIPKLDRERPVPMGTRERASVEDKERPALVGLVRPDRDAVVPEPGAKVKRPLRRPARGRGRGERAGQVPEERRRYLLQRVRDIEYLRPPVRTLRRVVTLPGDRAVELPDAGRVVVRTIDRAACVREDRVQHLKTPLHQVPALVIVREIDPVQEVGTVPRIGKCRGRPPAFPPEIRGDLGGLHSRRLVLRISGRDTRGPDRVDVDRKPPPAEDIAVSCCRVLLPEPHLDPVRPPGEQRRVHFVEGDVDALRPARIQWHNRGSQGVQVIEVPGCHPPIRDRTDLHHLPRCTEYGKRLPNPGSHLLTPRRPTRHARRPGPCPGHPAASPDGTLPPRRSRSGDSGPGSHFSPSRTPRGPGAAGRCSTPGHASAQGAAARQRPG